MKKLFSFSILMILMASACTFSGEIIIPAPTTDNLPTPSLGGNQSEQSILTPQPTKNPSPTAPIIPTPTDPSTEICQNLKEKQLGLLLLDYHLSVSRVDKEGQIRSSLYDVNRQTYFDIETDGYISLGFDRSIVVSPKGTALAILEFSQDDAHQSRLAILSNQKKWLTRPWKADWVRFSRWLDEEHLVLLGSEGPISTIFVYNPFTDEEQRFDFRYEDLYPVPLSDWEGQTITSINPTMTAVAYLRVVDNSLWVAMKDMQSGDILSEMSPVISTFPPIWSMTGEWFIIANATEFPMTKEDSPGKAEFFQIGRDGVSQITDLSSQYPSAMVEYYQMSSDEKQVGFWLYPDFKREKENAHLAVMDFVKGQVSELCIQTRSPMQGPLWVPGTKQFVIKVGEERSNNQIILVDLSDQSYSIIGSDIFEIFGWVKSDLSLEKR